VTWWGEADGIRTVTKKLREQYGAMIKDSTNLTSAPQGSRHKTPPSQTHLVVCTNVLFGEERERENLEDPDVEGRIKLRWMFMKWDVRAWTRAWIRKGTRWGVLVVAVMNLRVR
jgi:hypothetical protein